MKFNGLTIIAPHENEPCLSNIRFTFKLCLNDTYIIQKLIRTWDVSSYVPPLRWRFISASDIGRHWNRITFLTPRVDLSLKSCGTMFLLHSFILKQNWEMIKEAGSHALAFCPRLLANPPSVSVILCRPRRSVGYECSFQRGRTHWFLFFRFRHKIYCKNDVFVTFSTE